jgi:hypothetical protein
LGNFNASSTEINRNAVLAFRAIGAALSVVQ